MNYALGICLGASSVSYTLINRENNVINIVREGHRLHKGDPKSIFDSILNSIDEEFFTVAITGRKFRQIIDLPKLSEPEATERAYNFLYPQKGHSAIASLGGETFIVYKLDQDGRIADLITKNQCASGTGEFFLQQIKRMGLTVDESVKLSEKADPFKVSGRCSVFCKSDCTHALNKGVPKAEVASGLSLMIADKAEELLLKADNGNKLLVGGLTKNSSVMNYISGKMPEVETAPNSLSFESLGAALFAEENGELYDKNKHYYSENKSSFVFHEPLEKYKENVKFQSSKKRQLIENEKCIIGLDVGSTTTKAVLLGVSDEAVIASEYLYTNGDPIGASRKCYSSLNRQINKTVRITGIGVTGSGRHIAGIHALTEGVINEIIAHANAAVHFDPEVDTIFEIGGQDAKYTYIINKVPSDYAMNESCSAGTGSFIEEAAYETLGYNVTELEDIALKGEKPPNFSDQCAAFISSDIKTALQENISREDIVAGLVYSICLNYVNRVKGNRPVGKKIFMQGGVCYNRAIPVAMAALTGKEIIVPPDPGLMGAFGVALGVKEKIELGLMQEKHYYLSELAGREVKYKKPFICTGGKEKCDLGCKINIIEVNGKKFPFGGACNKYYNIRSDKKFKEDEFDLVKLRSKLLFDTFSPDYELSVNAPVIGINRSFHTHTLYPFYHNFFSSLGFKVILSDEVKEEGLEREYSSFCYPAELSLGLFQDLLDKDPDYIFLPKIFEMKAENHEQRLDFNCTCVFVSGENLFLKQAFKDHDLSKKIIDPNLNFSKGLESERLTFGKIAADLGIKDENLIDKAFESGLKYQNDFEKRLKEEGRKVIQEIESDNEKFGIVLTGRSYNAFAGEANKGIPRKFATNGVYAIPYDMLDFMDEKVDDNMYWEGGKKILKAAKIIKKHPQLFSTYISNFSCGPDSMVLTTFRDIMGAKPSLTLELDGHTADAGINTRIEAALDIIRNYRKMQEKISDLPLNGFSPSEIKYEKDKSWFVTGDGEEIPLDSDEVEILIPSMGDLASELFAAAFRSLGYNAKALKESNPKVLKYGRSAASGKECLPLLILTGLLLDYVENRWDGKKKIAFFVVQGAGNCRLGQYPVFLRNVIRKNHLKDVALMVLMNEDGFAGTGSKFAMRAIQALIASDVLDDIRSAVMANSYDPETGLDIFENEFSKVVSTMENAPDNFYDGLEELALNIKDKIPARVPVEDSKYVALLGEIYVRRDGFAHKWLNKYFAKDGFVVKDAYISEWILYVDYLLKIDLLEPDKSIRKKLERQIRTYFTRLAENKIKKTLAKSGYYEYSKTQIKPLLEASKHIIPLDFKGEPGLTTGTALHDSLEKYCGVINIGPFGCMPTRITEAIAAPEMKVKHKVEAMKRIDKNYKLSEVFNGEMRIPFLTLETDGNVYPQVIESRLETFKLQAGRTAELMEKAKNRNINNKLKVK